MIVYYCPQKLINIQAISSKPSWQVLIKPLMQNRKVQISLLNYFEINGRIEILFQIYTPLLDFMRSDKVLSQNNDILVLSDFQLYLAQSLYT